MSENKGQSPHEADSKAESESASQLVNLLRPIVETDSTEIPKYIKRYRVRKKIGAGAFGDVYLAEDNQLQRNVAIKVPKKGLLNSTERAEEYIREARMTAGLDHPNIVPVFDVGSTYDFPCFIVSKYIDGPNLKQAHQTQPFSPIEAIEIVIQVADALHFAHCKGVVHRDVKPANILIEESGKPFVVDLGLAIQESQQAAKGTVGTPAYMSPEQARGESHRVDGRSDVFSLGVTFFELLTGELPFRGETSSELIESIAKSEPIPPRQINDTIPIELERICLKALSHRTRDRYTTANDFARDLEAFVLKTGP